MATGSAGAKSRATAFVERFLRIPSEPEPPAGAHVSVRTFRAAPGYYRYLRVAWGLKRLAAGVGLLFGVFFLSAVPDFPFRFVVSVFEAFGVVAFLATLPLSYLMVHLDYELRWYIVTDRSLRVREGLVQVREQTISFANVQNVSIRQGPLQRAFGIADVVVRTAGGGTGGAAHGDQKGRDMHLGYFRGVDNAEQIRDAVLARVRKLRDSGLGDPDAAHHEHLPTAGPEAVAAARELLAEVRAARRSVERGADAAPSVG
jgi:membrane protein YdbS with pleckstrin-like domain